MKQKGKRILSLLLCAILVFAGLQFTPWSEEVNAAAVSNYGWLMNDNVSGDSLTITDDTNRGKVLKVTKGSGEASDWVSMTAPQVNVTGGTTYQLNFVRKLEEGTSIAVIYYEIIDEVHVKSYNVNMTTGTADVSGWCSESGKFTVTDAAERIEVRIYCRGASGQELCFDDFTLNPMHIVGETQTYFDSAVAWNYDSGYKGTTTNSDGTNNTITLDQAGDGNTGSLHFSKSQVGGGTKIAVKTHIDATVDETYVFEMSYKGTVQYGAEDSTKASIHLGNIAESGQWVTGTANANGLLFYYEFNDTLNIQNNTTTWSQVSAEFKAKNSVVKIEIDAPDWSVLDFYIDNVKVYLKSDASKTNLLSNGDFCQYIDKEVYFDSAVAWAYSGEDKDNNNTITVAESGYADMGSLYFNRQIWTTKPALLISQPLTYAEQGTYVFEAYIKGDTTSDNGVDGGILLYGEERNVESVQNGTLNSDQTYSSEVKFNVNSNNWTLVKAEYTMGACSGNFVIRIPQGGMCNFYIDNVKVYRKNDVSQTNLIENGDFCVDKMEVDTSVNLFTDGDFDDLQIAELNGVSLSLDGNIGVNFYMALNKVPETAYMQFTLPNGTVDKVTIPETKTENGYCFTAKVAAKEMTADIKAQMFLEDGTAITEEYTYTVEDYAKVILNGDYREETKTLVKAMLRYGAFAQMYFRSPHSGATLPNDGLEAYVDSENAWNYKLVAEDATWGGYNNESVNGDDSKNTITLAETGCNDTGSMHFVKQKEPQTVWGGAISMSNHAPTTPGTTYVFEMMYKGKVAAGLDKENCLGVNLGRQSISGQWKTDAMSSNVTPNGDAHNDTIYLTQDAEDWTLATATFQANSENVLIMIVAPQITWWGIDCYIDNVKVYRADDASKTNLLENGDFYKDFVDATISEKYKAVVEAADNVATIKSSQLVLTSGTTMKMKFELKKPTEELTILVNEEEAVTEIDGSICTVIIDNLAAHNLDAVLEVTISDGTDTLLVQNSALTYAYNVQQHSNNEALLNVVKALYLYNQAAKAYVNE